jgi:CRP-like cAMP-binding protein
MSVFTENSPPSAQPLQNKLLASLPGDEFQRIAPHLRSVPMKMKQVFQRQDEPTQVVYFPGGGACSLVKTLGDGRVAEVATVGGEGAIGASVFFGERIAECDALVRVPGPAAYALSADVFNHEMERHGPFFNHVVRYNQALMSQIMQTTVCNGLHSAEQRCCRWLLTTHDRAGQDEFSLTHEFLAMMLGVRRPTVTLIAANLQQTGAIHFRRGAVTIIDRPRLEAVSCECYQTVKSTWRRLLPDVAASMA